LVSLVAFFVQECPTCGRSLEVRVELLGKQVYCQHCGASFRAQNREFRSIDNPDTESLLRRAERLLAESQSETVEWGWQRT
jgi:hypothetical protein